MCMIDFTGYAQQGWQCPICKRVYSPTTPMCWTCGKQDLVATENTVGKNPKKNEPTCTCTSVTCWSDTYFK